MELLNRIDHPTEVVYATLRDRLSELVGYIPDLAELKRVSFERSSGSGVEITSHWRASTPIPAVAESVLPKDLFQWTQVALWKDDDRSVEYRLHGFGFGASGVVHFLSEGGGTVVKATVYVDIQFERFMVPKWVVKKVHPLVEKNVRRVLHANMVGLVNGLRSYLSVDAVLDGDFAGCLVPA